MTLKEKYPNFPFTGILSAIKHEDPYLFEILDYSQLIELGRYIMESDSFGKGVINMNYEIFAKKIAIWKLQNA